MAHEKTARAGESRQRTAVVLLAGGAGSRFEKKFHKLLAALPADTPGAADAVFAHALRNALDAQVGPVIVVTGALSTAQLRSHEGIDTLLGDDRVVIVHNENWARGQATSLAVGVEAARALGMDAVVVGLGDQPGIDPEAWSAVAAGTAPVTVATYGGRRANPVRLEESVWSLLPSSGDEGARVLMRSRPDLVGEVPCSGSPADIDTVEDLHRWQSN